MAPLARVRARAHALESLTAARNALSCAVADVLRSRSVRCSVGCRGWRVRRVLHGGVVVVCGACADANGYAGDLLDEDLASVPEVVRALRAG